MTMTICDSTWDKFLLESMVYTLHQMRPSNQVTKKAEKSADRKPSVRSTRSKLSNW